MTLDLSSMPEIPAFKAWDERSWVHRPPPSAAVADGGAGEQFFPTALVPHLSHPAVAAADPEQRRYLAAQHLYQWLRFTVDFEVSVVNRATLNIANGTSGVTVPDKAAETAYKIYVDEGFHSLESLRVLRRVEDWSGIQALPYDFGRFLGRLDAIGSDQTEHLQLVRLLQVVTFETLITAIFADIPSDRRVLPIVRRMVADHAADERCHHAYFATFFRELWAVLDPSTRVLTGRLLPGLITESLQPATRPAYDALSTCGFTGDQARDIVADAYNLDAVRKGIRFAARKTIALFQDCGVLEEPGAAEAFEAAGLLV